MSWPRVPQFAQALSSMLPIGGSVGSRYVESEAGVLPIGRSLQCDVNSCGRQWTRRVANSAK